MTGSVGIFWGIPESDHSWAILFGPFSPKSGLDFGCGVGRLTIPLAREARHATGVDVADNMLILARKHSGDAGVNAVFTKTIPPGQFDYIISLIVLQHIPPARGYKIIEDLWCEQAPRIDPFTAQ